MERGRGRENGGGEGNEERASVIRCGNFIATVVIFVIFMIIVHVVI